MESGAARRRRGAPLREGDSDGPLLVVVVALASRHDGRHLDEQHCHTDEQRDASVNAEGTHKTPVVDGSWQQPSTGCRIARLIRPCKI